VRAIYVTCTSIYPVVGTSNTSDQVAVKVKIKAGVGAVSNRRLFDSISSKVRMLVLSSSISIRLKSL
jgi:hypothetical protein